ncbi:MAG TPA: ABC transporter permease [Candidatus Sulfotelmatobacter sp.]|nr:ABC transporter permease [Candidatus Sulfotelmatobacter sp.]
MEARADRGRAGELFRRLFKKRSARLGLVILVAAVGAALFAPWLAPYSFDQGELLQRLQPPGRTDSGFHLLGTDQLGRDILSRLIYGSRVSLLVGSVSVILGGLVGLLLGLAAGYFGRRIDTIVMRVVDVQMAFPYVLLALAMVALLGPSLLNLIFVFTVTEWFVYARVVRATTLSLRHGEFVLAAQALGGSHLRILTRHIVPNVVSPLTVIASFEMAKIISTEAALSFLGLGVPPPTPSWGSMLADGREYLQDAWWVAVFAGVALMLTVLAINFLGDAARDALDPKMERPG